MASVVTFVLGFMTVDRKVFYQLTFSHPDRSEQKEFSLQYQTIV